MGQRHQVFLIARVRPYGSPPGAPGNRRCVAALHHQWCYGTLPLSATRRFISLVRQPENAAVVRAELRVIQDKYGSHGRNDPVIPDNPCPFTASLLGSTWTTDLYSSQEEHGVYTSGTSLYDDLLQAYMGCWEGDNNDGISIIDITDLDNPAYSFVQGDEVLDARAYLRAYYRVPETMPPLKDNLSKDSEEYQESVWDRRCFQCVEALDGVPLVSADCLREAWPRTRFRRGPPSRNAPEAARSVDSAPVSLADMALKLAVEHAVRSTDATVIEDLVLLPHKAKQVKDLLQNLVLFPDAAIQLLIRVLMELHETNSKIVDLSSFQLSGSQVKAVLDAYDEVESLNLSHNKHITVDDILTIISTPSLRRLVVIDCPSIDESRLLEVIGTQPSAFKFLEGLLHPALLTADKPESYPVVFALIDLGSYAPLRCNALPLCTPAQIVQALTDRKPGIEAIERGNHMYVKTMLGFSALHAATRHADQPYSERTVVAAPYQPGMLPLNGQNELWSFVVMTVPRICYGFVHYVRKKDGNEAAAQDGDSGTTDLKRVATGYTGRVYDLRGFLECMAREGRPMPDDAAVEVLQTILSRKPLELMTQNDLVVKEGSRFEDWRDLGF